jgi:NAD(P)-dependent dehydrogenase (short-subunit alcohol dehydrogenase family)
MRPAPRADDPAKIAHDSDMDRRGGSKVTGACHQAGGSLGEASDLVGATVFLASPDSNYVNGHILVVDGWWMGR